MGAIIEIHDIFNQCGFDSSICNSLNGELKKYINGSKVDLSESGFGSTALESAKQFKECAIGKTLIRECLQDQKLTGHPDFWDQHPAGQVKCEVDYLHSAFVSTIVLTTATTLQSFEKLCFNAEHGARGILAAEVANKSSCLIVGISRSIKGFFTLLIDSKDRRWADVVGKLKIMLNEIENNTESSNHKSC